MPDFPFHTECADVITGTLNPQNIAELVIHFYWHITHMVFDSRAGNASVIVGSDFFDTVTGNTLPGICGDIIRLYCKYCSADDFIIKRFQILRLPEMMSVSHLLCWIVHVYPRTGL